MSKALLLLKTGLAGTAMAGAALLVAQHAPTAAKASAPAARDGLIKTAATSCTDPAWSASSIYTGGQRVSRARPGGRARPPPTTPVRGN